MATVRKAALSVGNDNLRHAVLLDEHPLWLEAVEDLLRGIDIEVVGKTAYPDVALELISALQPSIFIAEIDVAGGDGNGVALIRRVRAGYPDVRTIVLSQRDDRDAIASALAGGATAYVVKTAHPDDLATAVRQAFAPSMFFASSAQPAGMGEVQPSEPEHIPLTRREVEILSLMAEGRSNAELAGGLWVTEQTVKFHLSNIYRKLGVANRTQASRWAQLHGLMPPAGASDASWPAGSAAAARGVRHD